MCSDLECPSTGIMCSDLEHPFAGMCCKRAGLHCGALSERALRFGTNDPGVC